MHTIEASKHHQVRTVVHDQQAPEARENLSQDLSLSENSLRTGRLVTQLHQTHTRRPQTFRKLQQRKVSRCQNPGVGNGIQLWQNQSAHSTYYIRAISAAGVIAPHRSRTFPRAPAYSALMRPLMILLVLFLAAHTSTCQKPLAPAPNTPDANAIMARVAANQDQTEAARTRYLYVQHAQVISRKGKTVRCEEITDSRVAPSPSGSEQTLLKLDGRLLEKHKFVHYTQLPAKSEKGDSDVKADESDVNITIDTDSSMDRDLVENMRNNLTKSHTKDGIGAGLFPLTSKSQADYNFQLLGREQMNGRQVFHLTFEPKDKSDFNWKGDAYIDSAAFQPVVVRTTMSRKIPFAVRALLGTSLPGLGFTVVYAAEPGGVWFPVNFGTEFKLKVLFFFHREIILSAQNRNFEETHVTSTILPAVSQ